MNRTTTVARRDLAAMIVVAAAVGLLAAGCAESAGGASGGQTGSRPPATAGGNSVAIPKDAHNITQTTGMRMPYHPTRDGTIYVQDKAAGKVVYSGPVRAGDNVVIDPRAQAFTINDQQVPKAPQLDTRRTYRLYFRPQ